jgi:N-methylhydantoinase B
VIPPRGVNGGHDGLRCKHWKVNPGGHEQELTNLVSLELRVGEFIRGHQGSGAGYGDPLERDPARVLQDVLEKYETLERAETLYGVVLCGRAPDSLKVDEAATLQRRSHIRQLRSGGVPQHDAATCWP